MASDQKLFRSASEMGIKRVMGLAVHVVCCRIRTEKYMQAVFAIAAVTLFVPVLYHRQRNEEVSGLDANAPGKNCNFRLQTSL